MEYAPRFALKFVAHLYGHGRRTCNRTSVCVHPERDLNDGVGLTPRQLEFKSPVSSTYGMKILIQSLWGASTPDWVLKKGPTVQRKYWLS